MDPDIPEEGIPGRKRWWVILSLSLIVLAIFWSVDPLVIYLSLGVAVFSLFKILQLRQPSPQQTNTYQTPVEKTYESLKPNPAWVFWQDVKLIFRKDSTGPKTPQQAKAFVALVGGFIGFIFFITILATLLGGGSTGDDAAVYYQQATDYYNNQKYDSAAYYYRLAILNDPENSELYFERGNAFLNANYTDSALIMYDETLARNPQHYLARYNKGYVYFNRKNYRQAIDETKKVIEYKPDYNEARLLIGDSFYNQSQLDSALQWYEGAYSNGYRIAILSHLMAYICDVKGETNRAINLYKEAIGQDSSIKDIYTRLGELVPGEEGNWYRQKAVQLQ